MGDMARWEGDAPLRLERAALDLFAERGYERTTVAQIAERAGLTERSFYRHFPDKREVLFAGGAELEAHLVAAVSAAPPELAPVAVLLASFVTAQEVFRPRGFLLERAAAIRANPPLQERELVKLASLSIALASALERRGVEEHTARLAAEIGLLVLRSASQTWVENGHRPFAACVRVAADELHRLADRLPA